MRYLIFVLLIVLGFGCFNSSIFPSTKRYAITIDTLSQHKQFYIPLQHEGWGIKEIRVLENTANDSVRIGVYLVLPPGKTGTFYRNDEPESKPFSYNYVPYKATKGKVVIEWSMTPE